MGGFRKGRANGYKDSGSVSLTLGAFSDENAWPVSLHKMKRLI
jgi:hypothetical protein